MLLRTVLTSNWIRENLDQENLNRWSQIYRSMSKLIVAGDCRLNQKLSFPDDQLIFVFTWFQNSKTNWTCSLLYSLLILVCCIRYSLVSRDLACIFYTCETSLGEMNLWVHQNEIPNRKIRNKTEKLAVITAIQFFESLNKMNLDIRCMVHGLLHGRYTLKGRSDLYLPFLTKEEMFLNICKLIFDAS